MVERITDPHHPVSLRHGTGRLPDGQDVPQPEPAPPVSYAERAWAALFVGIVLAAFVIGALR